MPSGRKSNVPTRLKSDRAPHWYARDGTPAYTVPNASRPGESRPTTLKDARKLGLVPSVSALCKVRLDSTDALEMWKIGVVLDMAHTLEKWEGESSEEWTSRVWAMSQDEMRKAMDLGTAVHDEIELIIRDEFVPGGDYDEYALPFQKWWKDSMIEPIAIEHSFACDAGFGGRIDMTGRRFDKPIIVDWKTTKTKPKEKWEPWRSYGRQLAAYAKGIDAPPDTVLLNVGISTTEPGRIEEFDWTPQRGRLEKSFLAARDLWMDEKDYDPRFYAQFQQGNHRRPSDPRPTTEIPAKRRRSV